MAPAKKSKTGVIIGWSFAGVTILAVLMVGFVFAIRAIIPQAEPGPAAGPAPTPAAMDDPASGIAVSCAGAFDCFVDPHIGSQALALLSEEYDWPCYREGEEDLKGYEVYHAEVCQGINDTNREFEQDIAVGYHTAPGQEGTDLVREFSVSTSGSAVEARGQTITAQDGADLAFAAFEATVDAVWPDDDELRRAALDSFTPLHEQCAEGTADEVDGASADTSLGFSVSCGNMNVISVDAGAGAVTSYGMLMRIVPSAP